MKWHRLPRIYVARMRRFRREIAVAAAVTAAALVFVIAAIAGGRFDRSNAQLMARPILFTTPSSVAGETVNDTSRRQIKNQIRQTSMPGATAPTLVKNQ